MNINTMKPYYKWMQWNSFFTSRRKKEYRELTKDKKIITVGTFYADILMFWHRSHYYDEINIKGVEDMVDKIIFRAREVGTIYLLNIEGHSSSINGRTGDNMAIAQNIGNGEFLSVYDLDATEEAGKLIKYDSGNEYDKSLKKLKPYFRKDASVILHGCNIGGGWIGQELQKHLSDIWGVPVNAGTGLQGIEDGLEGDIESCYLDKCTLIRLVNPFE